MQKAINFVRGSVLVSVKGAYPERFLNLCAVNGIDFWNMEVAEPCEIHIEMTAQNYKQVRRLAKRAMCHLHILKKRGLPFFTKRFKKRRALVAGLFVFCVIAWVFTSFVWIIDIDGFEKLDTAKLSRALSDNGVYIGAYRKNINIAELKNDILIKMPELSHISVNLIGSHAEICARERVSPPEIIPMSEPCDIVAKKGGIITDIVVKSGTAEVARGDTVTEGQLLASGYMTGRAGSTVITHAVADVKARTWTKITSQTPLKTLYKTYTGREKKQYTLILFGKRIKLYFNGGISYIRCDKIIQESDFALSDKIKLPISLETATLREYTLEEAEMPEKEAQELVSYELEKKIKPEDGEELINSELRAENDGKLLSVTVTAEYITPIGEERAFPE